MERVHYILSVGDNDALPTAYQPTNAGLKLDGGGHELSVLDHIHGVPSASHRQSIFNIHQSCHAYEGWDSG
eukprot:319361-Hanusia_phi.AAC.1